MEQAEGNSGETSSETSKVYNSAAAFVESGVQETDEDTCSICLEVFTVDEPCTLTICTHEFHLQCILEWAQRSQECPMCWRTLNLKDPESQELLEACAQEREIRKTKPVSPPNFLRFPVDDVHFPRFPVSLSDESDLERRIMQHLAAAAAAGFSRSGGVRHISVDPFFGRAQAPTSSEPAEAVTSSAAHSVGQRVSPACAAESGTLVVGGDSTRRLSSARNSDAEAEVRTLVSRTDSTVSVGSSTDGESSPHFGSSGGPAGDRDDHFVSIGDSLKSKWAAASSKYRETLSKSTKSIREKFRIRGGAVADFSAKAREVGAGVVRALERMAEAGPSTSGDRVAVSASMPSIGASGSFSGSPDAAGSLTLSALSLHSEERESPDKEPDESAPTAGTADKQEEEEEGRGTVGGGHDCNQVRAVCCRLGLVSGFEDMCGCVPGQVVLSHAE